MHIYLYAWKIYFVILSRALGKFKVCGPNVATLHDHMLVQYYYMDKLVVKNKHHKDTCCDETGLCAQSHQMPF